VISDLQIPFEASKALSFCVHIKRHFKIPDANVLNVGDEVDQLHGGQYPKDPNGTHTADSEIRTARDKLREWAMYFPQMKLAISNHGMRWIKKAAAAEIPSQMMRAYQEVLDLPKRWVWQEQWVFKTKHPFRMIHGMGYSGMNGHRTAALDGGISTVIGHLHSHAGISYITTSHQKIWGMNSGCLIDASAYAFSYGKDSRFKPCLGAAVILDSGKTPVWIPYE
jgi:hypothetical protein